MNSLSDGPYTCVHCKRNYKAKSGRDLCRTCWNTPDIRRKYPKVAEFASTEASHMGLEIRHDDAKWIHDLLTSSGAIRLIELGKNNTTTKDAVSFFGDLKQSNLKNFYRRLTRIEQTEKIEQGKINAIRNIANLLEKHINRFEEEEDVKDSISE